MKLNIGDKVVWTSSANGSTKTKTGEVVAVVPQGEGRQLRNRLGLNYEQKYKLMLGSSYDGLKRNHKSYLISVPTKSGRGKRRLYWPVVSLLRLAEEGEA